MPVKDKVSWTNQKIAVYVERDGRSERRRIKARVNGPLAVHQATHSDVLTTLTCVSCGLTVLTLPDKSEIDKAAALLLADSACTVALYQRTAEEVIECFPQAWKDWVYACRRGNRVVAVPVREKEVSCGKSSVG
jgi:hypothetical protein